MHNHPRIRDKMTALAQSIEIVKDLERRERGKIPGRELARASLANRLRIGVGTIENLLRGRLKRIDADLRDRLHALHINELEHEIARLSQELVIARLTAAFSDPDEIGEVETCLAQAREKLERAR